MRSRRWVHLHKYFRARASRILHPNSGRLILTTVVDEQAYSRKGKKGWREDGNRAEIQTAEVTKIEQHAALKLRFFFLFFSPLLSCARGEYFIPFSLSLSLSSMRRLITEKGIARDFSEKFIAFYFHVHSPYLNPLIAKPRETIAAATYYFSF